jgi:hypothetical protein
MLELAQLENKARFKNFTDNTRDFNQALTEGTFSLHDALTTADAF